MFHLTVADWITIVGGLVTAEIAVAHGTITLTNAIPDSWVPRVQAWCGILAALGGIIVTILSRMVVALALVFALSFVLLAADPASAQPAKRASAPIAAKSAETVDPLQKLMDDIAAIKAEFVTGVTDAINEADADAATLTNPSDPTSFRDPISHACYPAQIKFLQSLPQVQAIKAKAPYNLIVLFQRKRDLVAQIKAGLPSYLKVGCAALLGDEATILAQTLGMIGVTAGAGVLTGIFPPAAPLALPALSLPLLAG